VNIKSFVLALTVAGVISFGGCASSKPSESPSEDGGTATECTEPENPYPEGSGHHAGYEWAENNSGTCGGSSESFKEGCEEHEHQESEYEECKARQKR
jgi:hypothetical protein